MITNQAVDIVAVPAWLVYVQNLFGRMSMIDLLVRSCSGLPLVPFCLVLVGAVLSSAPACIQLLWAWASGPCLVGVGWWFGLLVVSLVVGVVRLLRRPSAFCFLSVVALALLRRLPFVSALPTWGQFTSQSSHARQPLNSRSTADISTQLPQHTVRLPETAFELPPAEAFAKAARRLRGSGGGDSWLADELRFLPLEFGFYFVSSSMVGLPLKAARTV